MSEPLFNKDRFREAMGDLSVVDLSDRLGCPKSSISMYLSGQRSPSKMAIQLIALTLGVNPAWLCGLDVPKYSNAKIIAEEIQSDNLFRIEPRKFRMLGNIACGEPIFADEETTLYVEAGAEVKADFCLRAKGDSMQGARIYDGDIVFIKMQDMVNDGEIAAVLIDDEATLKRVQYNREENELLLFSENPQYRTLRFTGDELSRIRIIGKAVAFQSDVKEKKTPPKGGKGGAEVNVGERIKALRLKRGHTLLELAEILGVKEATVQRYESGAIKNIKRETIVALASALNCTPVYLMGWSEEVPPHSITAVFKDRLRTLRKERNLTQQDLAEALKPFSHTNKGCSKSSINMYERGEREPSFETLKAIADFFNVDIDYLFGRKERREDLPASSPCSEQSTALLEIFEKLDVVGKAKVLAFAAELIK